MTDSDPLIGKILAHYRVLEKIGEGGMGVVYKARDLHLDRLVALKTLPAEKLDDVVRRQRFVQEVTKNGGFAAAETVDGKYLYYTPTKAESTDLWKMPVEGGEPTKIAEGIVISNFAVTARGLYYMTQPDPHSNAKLVNFVSFANNATSVVATLKQGVYHGFSLSPDERWLLYAPHGRGGSNVMVVEDFDLDRSGW